MEGLLIFKKTGDTAITIWALKPQFGIKMLWFSRALVQEKKAGRGDPDCHKRGPFSEIGSSLSYSGRESRGAKRIVPLIEITWGVRGKKRIPTGDVSGGTIKRIEEKGTVPENLRRFPKLEELELSMAE